MTITKEAYPERVLLVLTPNGTLKGAHQERLEVVMENGVALPDFPAKQHPAEPLDASTLLKLLPDQGVLLAQVQQLTDDCADVTADRDALRAAVKRADETRDAALTRIEALLADNAQLAADFAATNEKVAAAVRGKLAVEAERDALAEQVADLLAPPADPAVSSAQARLALKAAGLFAPINAHMMALPEDDAARIHWEFSPYFHRSNPVLAEVAETLGLQSAQIDQLFAAAAAF